MAVLLLQKNSRNFPSYALVLFFHRNCAHWATIDHVLTITLTAILHNHFGFSVLNFENFWTKRFAGSTTNAKVFVDFGF
jgi:hypothetical protein